MATAVNYIKHLNSIYTLMAEDSRLSPHHISLYLAIFQLWNLNHFQEKVSICRSEMKQLSKIGSNNTYSKCINQLHDFGYIKYSPSFNPMKGSSITCIRFDTSKRESPTPLTISQKGSSLKLKEKPTKRRKQKAAPPPLIDSVIDFFKKEFTKDSGTLDLNVEAEKFHNHFSSNGWKVGGKAPMKDWNAAARNWIHNARRFVQEKSTLKPGHLNSNSNKNYHEPL